VIGWMIFKPDPLDAAIHVGRATPSLSTCMWEGITDGCSGTFESDPETFSGGSSSMGAGDNGLHLRGRHPRSSDTLSDSKEANLAYSAHIAR